MPQIDVKLPDRINDQIDRLVEQGEFLNREQAVEELLSMGMSAYDTSDESDEVSSEELFTQAVEDQQDPAMRDDDDEYTL
ncbi:MAG: CopG family transcriptional regulator [Halobacteriaceae archaeon]